MTLRLYFNRQSGGISNQPKWALHCEETNEVRYFNHIKVSAPGYTESVLKRTTFNADSVLVFPNANLEFSIDSVTIISEIKNPEN